MKSFRSLFPRGPGSEFAGNKFVRDMIGKWSVNDRGVVGKCRRHDRKWSVDIQERPK